MFEMYFFLFIDSLFASLILPIRTEMVFPAMVVFGGYEKYLVFLVALFASIFGLLINYLIGKYLTLIKKSKAFLDKKSELEKIEDIWNKYVIWFLPLLVINPVGSVFCLFSGFFRTKFWYFLSLILAGRLIYYFLNITP